MDKTKFNNPLFSNTSWLFFEKISRLGLSFLINIIIVRYLGPENYGLLNYSQSLILLFTCFVDLGLNEIVVRDLVSNPDKENSILGSALFLQGIGVFVFGLLLLITNFIFISEKEVSNLLLIFFLGILFKPLTIFQMVFEAKLEGKCIAIANLASFLSITLLKACAVFFDLGLIFLCAAFSMEYLLAALFLIILYLKGERKNIHLKVEATWIKALLKNSFPLFIAGLMVMIYFRIDQIMIKEMVSVKELGIYAAGQKLCEIWYFIPQLLMITFYPKMLKTSQINDTALNELTALVSEALLFISLAISLVLFFFGNSITNFIYGEKYIGSGELISVYIWTSVFVFQGVLAAKWLLTKKLQYIFIFKALTGVVLNLILNFYLIPKYSIVGAALATIIAQFAASVLVHSFFKTSKELFYIQLRSFFFPFSRKLLIRQLIGK